MSGLWGYLYQEVIRRNVDRDCRERSSGIENAVTAGRSYRTNIEVLRDVLTAARKPAPKTRIIGLANLNPRSLQRYLRFCTEHELVSLTAGGYVVTRRGSTVLDAIEGLLAKTNEVEWAVQRLKRNVSDHPVPDGSTGAPLHHISRWAWKEILLDGGNDSQLRRSGGFVRAGSEDELDTLQLPAEYRTEGDSLEQEVGTEELRAPANGSSIGTDSRPTVSKPRARR